MIKKHFKLILVIAIIGSASIISAVSFVMWNQNAPPVAIIEAEEIQQYNTDITFDGSNSYDPNGEIRRWEWNFGDGCTASGAVVRHSFSAFGIFNVTLTVTDFWGATDQATFSITVHGIPPVADIFAPTFDNKKTDVPFDASGSYGVNGTIVSYEWDFDDGANGTGVNILHQFNHSGSYQVTLRVIDEWGGTDQDIHSINIYNHFPVASFVASETIVWTDYPIVFDASASFDPDGDALLYSWDFGDSSGSASGIVVGHSYSSVGSYWVVLDVTDDDANNPLSTTDMVEITVNTINDPPVANFTMDPDPTQTLVYTGELIDFDGSPSYDPDGSIVEYYWYFDDPLDPTPATGENVIHTYNLNGLYEVTLDVTDNQGANGTYQVSFVINII